MYTRRLIDCTGRPITHSGENMHSNWAADALNDAKRKELKVLGVEFETIPCSATLLQEGCMHTRKVGAGMVGISVGLDASEHGPGFSAASRSVGQGLRIAIDASGHTSRAVYLDDSTVLNPHPQYADKQGLVVNHAAGRVDSLVVKANYNGGSYQLLTRSADCPPIAGTFTVLGEPFMFIAHCGYKGLYGGLIENTSKLIKDLGGVDEGSLSVVIGPSAQAIEVPVDSLGGLAAARSSFGVLALWQDSETGVHKALLNNQYEAAYRLIHVFGKPAIESLVIIDHNSITDFRFASYRGANIEVNSFIEAKPANISSASARNMLAISPIIKARY